MAARCPPGLFSSGSLGGNESTCGPHSYSTAVSTTTAQHHNSTTAQHHARTTTSAAVKAAMAALGTDLSHAVAAYAHRLGGFVRQQQQASEAVAQLGSGVCVGHQHDCYELDVVSSPCHVKINKLCFFFKKKKK